MRVTRMLIGLVVLCTLGLQMQSVPARAFSSKLSTSGVFDFNYGADVKSQGGSATGYRPESKLFYTGDAAGEAVRWWGVFGTSGPSPTAGIYLWELVDHVWQPRTLLPGADVWDKADVLFDGATAYVSLRDNGAVKENPRESLLYRIPYLGNGTWGSVPPSTLITGQNPKTLTIAKDSSGRLWSAYQQGLKIKVGRTTPGGTSFTYLNMPTTDVSSVDIAAVTAFGGDRIGVAWSDQVARKDFFAWRYDTDPIGSWRIEVAYGGGVGGCPTQNGTRCADDHLNVKAVGDTVYIAVKTSLNEETGTASDPLVTLLRRSPGGTWTSFPVSPVSQNATRPIVQLDPTDNKIYVFATRSGEVDVWESSLSTPAFNPAGYDRWIKPKAGAVNDATGTKQLVSSATGTVVLASVNNRSEYWHNEFLASSSSSTISANPVSTSTPQNAPVSIQLSGSDVGACELTFSIVAGPSNGSLGSIADAPCTSGSPNTDRATVTYSPVAAFTGTDSFTYTVDDGSATSDPATVTIAVHEPETGISFRSASSATNGSAFTLDVPAPAGVVSGDVLLAVVDVRGTPAITAPAGWTLVRLDEIATTMRQAVYVRAATGSEPPSYGWSFSKSQTAVAGILAYSGVDATSPVEVSSGLANGTAVSTITAPSITTSSNGDEIIGFFGMAGARTMTPPAGTADRFDIAASGVTYPISALGADVQQPTAGPTNDMVAVASGTGKNIGQQIALRPAGP